jgi:hypothetical protein
MPNDDIAKTARLMNVIEAIVAEFQRQVLLRWPRPGSASEGKGR